MGMFDYLQCEYELPGTKPQVMIPPLQFQTKSFDRTMDDYLITKTGQLMVNENGPGAEFKNVDYTGTIDFYTSNWSGTHAGVIFTREGEDYEGVDYEATFVNGLLTKISQTEYQRSVTLPISDMQPSFKVLTEEDRKNISDRENESLIGKTLYMQWGGQKIEPIEVSVVAEAIKQICIKDNKDMLIVLDRASRDRVFFDSLDAVQAYKDENDRLKKEAEDIYEAKLKAKKGK